MDQNGLRNVEVDAELYANRDTPSHLRDPKQKYCVMAVVAPEGTSAKSKQLMLKVFGCKKTKAQANELSARIHKDNPFFDVFVLETCQWAALPPDTSAIGDIHSNTSSVQAILDEHKQETIRSKQDLVDRVAASRRLKEQQSAIEEDEAVPTLVSDVPTGQHLIEVAEEMKQSDPTNLLDRISKTHQSGGVE